MQKGTALRICFALSFLLVLDRIWVSAATATQRSGKQSKKAHVDKTTVSKNSGCNSCGAATLISKGRIKKAVARPALPCHPSGYLDPKVATRFETAKRELKRLGIVPRVTSAWRSSKAQAWLHNCSTSRRCRTAHPGLYGALPSGTSLHEAGFAVDIAGIASGRRGSKRLTANGRQIIRVMRKHGFAWRYGLADPVHFEANPRTHGYRSVQQAISRNQGRCQPGFRPARIPQGAGKSRIASSQRGRRDRS